MAASRTGACSSWATVADLCSPCDDYAFPAGLLTETLEMASDVLFELSGRRFPGVCTTTVRPCTRRAFEEYGPATPGFQFFSPHVIVGCGCQRRARCGCGDPDAITLGGYPIIAITTVKVDGVALDAARYRVDDYRWLVRLADADGTNPGWPCCQDLSLADTEDDTFSVTFTYGSAPPAMGVRAAARLACELAMACEPEFAGKCLLSQRVQQVTRQGVTVVLDRLDAIQEDFTGIPEVDLFLRTYNPAKLRRRAQVISPDIGRRVHRIGT